MDNVSLDSEGFFSLLNKHERVSRLFVTFGEISPYGTIDSASTPSEEHDVAYREFVLTMISSTKARIQDITNCLGFKGIIDSCCCAFLS